MNTTADRIIPQIVFEELVKTIAEKHPDYYYENLQFVFVPSVAYHHVRGSSILTVFQIRRDLWRFEEFRETGAKEERISEVN